MLAGGTTDFLWCCDGVAMMNSGAGPGWPFAGKPLALSAKTAFHRGPAVPSRPIGSAEAPIEASACLYWFLPLRPINISARFASARIAAALGRADWIGGDA